MTSFSLPVATVLLCLIIGIVLGLIYLLLLWLTIKNLNLIKHKALFLFFSAAVRLFLFLSCAIIFSNHNAARFLWIVISFVITRLIVVMFVNKTRGQK